MKGISMKRLIAASTLALACTFGTAHADSWDGPYVGAEGGYGWGNVAEPFGNVGGPFNESEAPAKQTGGLFGVNLGYNWLVQPKWLVGIEGNWDWSTIRGNDGGSGGDVNAVDQNWNASLRARAGFLVTSSTLLFATGGYELMNADLKDERIPQSHTAMFNGWTFGGGIEQEIVPNVTARLEYRWSDYSQKRVSFAPDYDIGATPKINAIMAGVSWHF
jgi:outer membrane immunogenic protein